MTRAQKKRLFDICEKCESGAGSNCGGGVNKVTNRKVYKLEKKIFNQRRQLDELNSKRKHVNSEDDESDSSTD